MIIYNVTVNITSEVEVEWKEWMSNIHIPEVLATGYFESNKFLKLLNEVPEAEGATYAIQYFTTDIEKLSQYMEYQAERLQKAHLSKFPNKFVAFRTVLEEV